MGRGYFYSGVLRYGRGVAVGMCLPSEGSSATGRTLRKIVGC